MGQPQVIMIIIIKSVNDAVSFIAVVKVTFYALVASLKYDISALKYNSWIWRIRDLNYVV